MNSSKPSRSAVTPRAEKAGSLEISTAATHQAGFTRQPRLIAIARLRSCGPRAALLLIVRLSSERVRQAVRQDCSFAKKQASPPALLVVVPSAREVTAGRDTPPSKKGRASPPGSAAGPP